MQMGQVHLILFLVFLAKDELPFFSQTLRLQQLSAAAIHLLGMALPCPVLIPEREWTGSRRWLNVKRFTSSLKSILVTSNPGVFDLLPFASFVELEFPLSDSRTSEFWDSVGCPFPVFSFSVPPLAPFEALVLRNRPPVPLGRRIAWRWRDLCKYGCGKERKNNVRNSINGGTLNRNWNKNVVTEASVPVMVQNNFLSNSKVLSWQKAEF